MWLWEEPIPAVMKWRSDTPCVIPWSKTGPHVQRPKYLTRFTLTPRVSLDCPITVIMHVVGLRENTAVLGTHTYRVKNPDFVACAPCIFLQWSLPAALSVRVCSCHCFEITGGVRRTVKEVFTPCGSYCQRPTLKSTVFTVWKEVQTSHTRVSVHDR